MNAAPQRRSMGTVRLSGSLVQWRTEVFLAWTASDPRRSSASTSHAPGFFNSKDPTVHVVDDRVSGLISDEGVTG